MKDKKLNSPDLYINRELSWLKFNERVLAQALRDDLALMERLKFLSIFSSNLDEFFMVRVAGLMQQKLAGIRKHDPSGMTPSQQLKEIAKQVGELLPIHSGMTQELFKKLRAEGIYLLGPDEWDATQQEFLKNHFRTQLYPVLTPLAMDKLKPAPLLPAMQLSLIISVSGDSKKSSKSQVKNAGCDCAGIVVIAIPTVFSRFITIPAEHGVYLAAIEDIIAANLKQLYPNQRIDSVDYFRITRDADVEIQEDEAGDLLSSLEQAIIQRRRRSAIRLEISKGCSSSIRKWLIGALEIDHDFIYEIDSIVDPTSLMEISGRPGFEELNIPDWPPAGARDLLGSDDIFESIQQNDIMLFHPYESFDPVVELLEKSAQDADTIAIKQTLYRTSGNSPIIAALEEAAENGKHVTVLVELKARFDEERNLNWARRLEDAGCNVIYGVAGLKTHCKALMVIRRTGGAIRRYVHLSTGNYNDKTARLYSDIGLLTSDSVLCSDAAALFNLMTGASEAVKLTKLTIAPTGLRDKFYQLIEREIQASTSDRPGLIMVKVNSLQDKGICQALYRASMAGVKIMLNVRGICCLRPGVKGVSDNIKVVSIVDRFLEHARIFYFRNAGNEELYLASADWMGRNLDKRIESFFPVTSGKLQQRLIHALDLYFKDDSNSFVLGSDGIYRQVKGSKKGSCRAQEILYNEAVKAVESSGSSPRRFRPISKPKK